VKRFFLWIIRRFIPNAFHPRLLRRELAVMDAVHRLAWCPKASLKDRCKALRDQADYCQSLATNLEQVG